MNWEQNVLIEAPRMQDFFVKGLQENAWESLQNSIWLRYIIAEDLWGRYSP